MSSKEEKVLNEKENEGKKVKVEEVDDKKDKEDDDVDLFAKSLKESVEKEKEQKEVNQNDTEKENEKEVKEEKEEKKEKENQGSEEEDDVDSFAKNLKESVKKEEEKQAEKAEEKTEEDKKTSEDSKKEEEEVVVMELPEIPDEVEEQEGDYLRDGMPVMAATPEEILDFAKYLGIIPEMEFHLLWIAKRAVVAPMPEDWKEFTDEHGYPYYHNTVSKVTTREHPMDHYFRMLVAQEREDLEKYLENPELTGILPWMEFHLGMAEVVEENKKSGKAEHKQILLNENNRFQVEQEQGGSTEGKKGKEGKGKGENMGSLEMIEGGDDKEVVEEESAVEESIVVDQTSAAGYGDDEEERLPDRFWYNFETGEIVYDFPEEPMEYALVYRNAKREYIRNLEQAGERNRREAQAAREKMFGMPTGTTSTPVQHPSVSALSTEGGGRRGSRSRRSSRSSLSSSYSQDDIVIDEDVDIKNESVVVAPEEIIDMAQYLGVDPVEESYLLPLVKRAVLAPLPPNWQQYHDQNGYPYFFNAINDESTREHPLDHIFFEMVDDERTMMFEMGGSMASKTLEPIMKFRTVEGNVFYYDFSSDQSFYLDPRGERLTNIPWPFKGVPVIPKKYQKMMEESKEGKLNHLMKSTEASASRKQEIKHSRHELEVRAKEEEEKKHFFNYRKAKKQAIRKRKGKGKSLKSPKKSPGKKTQAIHQRQSLTGRDSKQGYRDIEKQGKQERLEKIRKVKALTFSGKILERDVLNGDGNTASGSGKEKTFSSFYFDSESESDEEDEEEDEDAIVIVIEHDIESGEFEITCSQTPYELAIAFQEQDTVLPTIGERHGKGVTFSLPLFTTGKDGKRKEVQCWDLHVGAVLDVLGVPILLKQATFTTLLWLQHHGSVFIETKNKMEDEYMKYSSFLPEVIPDEAESIRRGAVSLRQLVHGISRARNLLEKIRPTLAQVLIFEMYWEITK